MSLLIDVDLRPYVLPDCGALDIDKAPYCWEREAHIERYQFACMAFKDRDVIDFGCGVGYGSLMLSRVGNRVLGIDQSYIALGRARARRNGFGVPHDRLFFGTSGSALLEADRGCVAFEVIEHLDDPQGFIDSLGSSELIASVPVIPTVGFNPFHKHDFTEESFEALISSRFRIHYSWIQVRPFQRKPEVLVLHGVRK